MPATSASTHTTSKWSSRSRGPADQVITGRRTLTPKRQWEFVVSVILIAAFTLPRTSARWSPKHPALILGARAVAVSAVIFPLLALTRMPAWTGVIASLLAGAALVAGVWVARLKHA